MLSAFYCSLSFDGSWYWGELSYLVLSLVDCALDVFGVLPEI